VSATTAKELFGVWLKAKPNEPGYYLVRFSGGTHYASFVKVVRVGRSFRVYTLGDNRPADDTKYQLLSRIEGDYEWLRIPQ